VHFAHEGLERGARSEPHRLHPNSRRGWLCAVVGLPEVFWNGSVWSEAMIRIATVGQHEIETDLPVLVVTLPSKKVRAALLGVLKRNKLKEDVDYLIEEGE